MRQHNNSFLLLQEGHRNRDWYLRAVVERVRQRCMRVGPVHACLCACDVERGQTGPETKTTHPHPPWTVMSEHRRTHALNSKWSSTC